MSEMITCPNGHTSAFNEEGICRHCGQKGQVPAPKSETHQHKFAKDESYLGGEYCIYCHMARAVIEGNLPKGETPKEDRYLVVDGKRVHISDLAPSEQEALRNVPTPDKPTVTNTLQAQTRADETGDKPTDSSKGKCDDCRRFGEHAIPNHNCFPTPTQPQAEGVTFDDIVDLVVDALPESLRAADRKILLRAHEAEATRREQAAARVENKRFISLLDIGDQRREDDPEYTLQAFIEDVRAHISALEQKGTE